MLSRQGVLDDARNGQVRVACLLGHLVSAVAGFAAFATDVRSAHLARELALGAGGAINGSAKLTLEHLVRNAAAKPAHDGVFFLVSKRKNDGPVGHRQRRHRWQRGFN